VTLGIINGGFGLQLTDNLKASNVGYAVGAAIIWGLWMAVILIALIKSRGKPEGETGPKVFGGEKQTGDLEMMPSDTPQRSHARQSHDLDETRTEQKMREM
jgi:hypothetical protein